MNSQPQPVGKKPTFTQNPTTVRKLVAILFVSGFVIGPFASLIWAIMMSQYSRKFRIGWFILSGILPIGVTTISVALIMGGAMGGESGAREAEAILNSTWFGLVTYVGFPAAIVFPFVPFIYTFIWPLGRQK